MGKKMWKIGRKLNKTWKMRKKNVEDEKKTAKKWKMGKTEKKWMMGKN